MNIDEVMTKVIRSRGFREEVLVSEILRRPENAGLICRREKEIMPFDTYEPQTSFTVKVKDLVGKNRRLCFTVAGNYPILTSRREPSLPRELGAHPTAWCLSQNPQNNRLSWTCFEVSLRILIRKNKYVKSKFVSGREPHYLFTWGEKTISIAVKTLHNAFKQVLSGEAGCGPTRWDEEEHKTCTWLAFTLSSDYSRESRELKKMLERLILPLQHGLTEDEEKLLIKICTTLKVNTPGRLVYNWRRIQSLSEEIVVTQETRPAEQII